MIPVRRIGVLLAFTLLITTFMAGCGGGNDSAIVGVSNAPDQILFSITAYEDFDATSSRTVSWRTPEDMTQSSVYLLMGTTPDDDMAWNSAIEIPGEMTAAAELSENYGKYNHFETQITGLVAGEYTYRVGASGGIDFTVAHSSEDGVSGGQSADAAYGVSDPMEFTIRSPEEMQQRSVFLYFGDAQPDASIEEYATFGALVGAARAANPDADLALQCGDIGNQGSAREEWSAFLQAASPAFEGLPLLTAPGNHEVTPYVNAPGRKPVYYLNVFSLPKNGPEGFEEEYYSLDYGDAHILSLSSNYLDPFESYSDDEAESARIAAEIDAWIEEDLANAGYRWKIVLMHQPAYPLVGDSTTTGMTERWIPIFDRAGVDLILCGHQHAFMRTWPLVGGKEDAAGLVQIMGNASQKSYEDNAALLPFVAFEMGGISGWHTVTVSPHHLSVDAFDSTARLLDSWIKEK